jgi:hypothetical protein
MGGSKNSGAFRDISSLTPRGYALELARRVLGEVDDGITAI